MEEYMKNNNYEKMDIRIVSEDTSCFKKLDELESWKDSFEKVNFVGLFINDEMFLNEYAKKIFQNILINGCEFEQTIKYNEYYYPNIMIDTRKISYLECVEKIKLITLMMERANDISKLINNNLNVEKVKQGLLAKYKALIGGIKTTYEKGLILVKMLFKDGEDNQLLCKYYRLIQKKEEFEVRKEIFYELLHNDEEQLVVNSQNVKKRSYMK